MPYGCEPMEKVNLHMPVRMIKKVRQTKLGKANFSEAIRVAVEAFYFEEK